MYVAESENDSLQSTIKINCLMSAALLRAGTKIH